MGGILLFLIVCSLLTAGVMIYEGIEAAKERSASRRAVNALRRRNRREWKHRLYTCP